MTQNLHLETGVALYTAGQIREIEQAFARNSSSGTYPLMEAAGKAAFEMLKAHWPEARKILILTGKGNNGGDGFVIARLATEQRFKVTLCEFCSTQALKGDALTAHRKLPGGGLQRKEWEKVELNQYDLIVDAMLGTGIHGNLKEPFAAVISRVNQSNIPVLAIDMPSGLEADTGNTAGIAIKASVTITFIGLKRGLYTGEAANFRGIVKLARLGIPESSFQAHEFNVIAENWHSQKHKILPRPQTAHKGEFGHCLVIGGSKGFLGAAVLAASASLFSGSGLTSVIVEEGASEVVCRQPELMVSNDSGFQNADSLDHINGLLNKINCLVVGPGLGLSQRAEFWMPLLTRTAAIKDTAKVFDADALNWLALNPDRDPNRILTPHPYEAGRLLGITSQEVNQDRFTACQKIVEKYGGICVLKGAGTLVCDQNGLQIVCPVGNPGMASGGMGDVLSGIIGALLAQGFSLVDAAVLGVSIHGEAADRAAENHGYYRGLTASGLLVQLPPLLNPQL